MCDLIEWRQVDLNKVFVIGWASLIKVNPEPTMALRPYRQQQQHSLIIQGRIKAFALVE